MDFLNITTPTPNTNNHQKLTCQLDIFKTSLNTLKDDIDQSVLANTPMIDCLQKLSCGMDKIIQAVFEYFELHSTAVFAVGGYGRQQLYLHSDVDILIIYDQTACQSLLTDFVQAIWQLGITPAICVQSLHTLDVAVQEHTIATAWLDARLVCGNADWHALPYDSVKKYWQIPTFFDVKLAETKARHTLHGFTEYNLEPNIKTHMGGLRDIHLLGWLSKFIDSRHKTAQIADFLLPNELACLSDSFDFISRIRHHLHYLSAKGYDVLSFDYQHQVAKRLNLDGQTNNTLAEQLMKRYYHHATATASLTDMLCQLFYEKYTNQTFTIKILDDEFALKTVNQTTYLCTQHHLVFDNNPASILRLFLVMGHHNIAHICPQTLRLLQSSSQNIDDNYRHNTYHKRLFIQNLKQPTLLFHRLRMMKRFGVLGRYLPDFGHIMGLMQFDLFHRYTVDEHTLLLVKILDDFDKGKFGQLSDIYRTLCHKYLLVITAIFHDIAKGLDGDHSVIGAKIAKRFCESHNLPKDDQSLIEFLVSHHLTMSLVAQKQDISDIGVIEHFAKIVGDIDTLNYLYILTVADMNATNSELWNNWRATLLSQLYSATHHFLSTQTTDQKSLIKKRQTDALAILAKKDNFDKTAIDNFWQKLSDTYFLKHNKDELAWHADIIAYGLKDQQAPPYVATDIDLTHLNLLKLFIYTKDMPHLFSKMIGVIDMAGFSVMGAHIFTTKTGFALNTLTIIDNDHDWAYDNLDDFDEKAYYHRHDDLCDRLIKMIEDDNFCYTPKKRYHNPLKAFVVPTVIEFIDNNFTELHLVTKDRPSLLAKIGQVFDKFDIIVHSARITTLGERAEDVFYLTDSEQLLLDKNTQARLACALDDLLTDSD